MLLAARPNPPERRCRAGDRYIERARSVACPPMKDNTGQAGAGYPDHGYLKPTNRWISCNFELICRIILYLTLCWLFNTMLSAGEGVIDRIYTILKLRILSSWRGIIL